MDELPLNGFGISSFRSFGNEVQLIAPLKKINVIIGENNSGKSNVIRFIRKVLTNPHWKFSTEDMPQSLPNKLSSVPFLVKTGDKFWASIFPNSKTVQLVQDMQEIFKGLTHKSIVKDHIWLERLNNSVQQPLTDFLNINLISENEREQRRLFETVWRALTPGTSGGSLQQHWLPDIIKRLQNNIPNVGKIVFVPAARKIETRLEVFKEEFNFDKVNANPIIELLSSLANPEYTNPGAKQKFNKLQEFVRTVLNDPNITIEIPANKLTINVSQHGRFLPIETLGTGVFQAVLLAAEATAHENSIFCIEEPEQHLHPEVQRQVVRYLNEKTTNQYFITTHSAHIMDAVACCVISVRLEQGWSKVDLPLSNVERRTVCHRLGYRPSDLLQSNCVIWIEGPSDRIYLNHWIKAVADQLVEGVHYSFATYGGRVLSNFSADDETEGLIQILPINRFVILVMDSDLKEQSAEINATKKRISDEVAKCGGVAWVTDGREIENYLPRSLRLSALQEVHEAAELELSESTETKFSKPLNFKKSDHSVVADNFKKIAIAEHVVSRPADLSVLDLNEKINEIVAYIKNANHLDR